MRRGRGYSYRGSVVGRQWEVKGHRGNGESSVHLYRSGSHTGKTLRVEEVAGGVEGDREVSRKRGEQVMERARSSKRRRNQMNKS